MVRSALAMAGASIDRALLIVGPARLGASPRAGLAAVAEVLRAGASSIQLRELGGEAGGARAPELTAGAVVRAVSDLAAPGAGRRWAVVVGAAVAGEAGPDLVLDEDAPRTSWPLAGLAALDGAAPPAVRLVILDDADPDLLAAAIEALGADGLRLALAATDGGVAAVDALVEALRGGAVDPARGCVTAASLVASLRARGLPLAVGAPPDAGAIELFEPPGLERLWRLGWSLTSGGPRPSLGDDPAVGTILPGRFRLEARLAEGGFGIVYRARQLTVGRDVAIKVLRSGLDPFSDEGRLFVQEIQAVGRLDHPNVVRVYQADVTADGRLFFAMELLDGRDLQAQVEAGPTALADAIALVAQLLAGLDAAHRAGLVHADVKPGNVIVCGARAVLVDFGLAQLRRADEVAPVLGGTPAYMAPEQLAEERIDARSDQFSAALVLIALVTGWRRTRARDLVPPPEILARLDDARVRDAVTRALALTPGDRFSSTAAFAAALTGAAAPDDAPARPPFHGLASFDERDDGRLYGRDRELAHLSERVLHRRLVIVTAPSGVGKTSLLRAGLRPRLEALAARVVYASCRTDHASVLAPGRVGDVVLLDQVETALKGAAPPAAELLSAALSAAMRADGPAVVLSVREDFLARLIERGGAALTGAPIIRIGPLDPAGARDAIARPLAARRLTIAPDLLERLLTDLIAAGRQLGAELGWGALEPIYPPHLQLACAVLYERLPAGAANFTLEHYRSLGGFTAIVGEHLERVLDDLDPDAGATARDLFLALVTAAHGRSARTEAELVDTLGPRASQAPAVLEHLRAQGLVVRVRRADGEAVWELIHDSLVPRVLAWIDRRDLARRRAVELVRYHLRRSSSAAPSLLSRAELRELDSHRDAVGALDAEWSRTEVPGAEARSWTPLTLVARSRQVHRRTLAAALALVATVIAGVGAAIFERWRSANARKAELARRDRDLGLIAFEFAPFDWNVEKLEPIDVPIADLPDLRWAIHTVKLDPDTDVEDPGEPYPPERFRVLSSERLPTGTRFDTAEASGGPAFLVISGRNRPGEPDCGPSIIPIRALPGYPQRKLGPQRHRIPVPSCQATLADMIEIPAGEFIYGGPGEPPSPTGTPAEQTLHLPAFAIDRHELTNALAAHLASATTTPDLARRFRSDAPELAASYRAEAPITNLGYASATTLCRMAGKRLARSTEWTKALRGGLVLDGRANPAPRRNFPWGLAPATGRANLAYPDQGPLVHAVTADVGDRSPYGVIGLAGNVQEWVHHPAPAGAALTRGGNWAYTTPGSLSSFMTSENAHDVGMIDYATGARCAGPVVDRAR